MDLSDEQHSHRSTLLHTSQHQLMMQICAVARLLLVALVFLFNLFSLLRMLFCKIRSTAPNRSLCVHSATTALLLCTCLTYVLLWLPHLALSLYDRHWSSSNALEQCNVQQLVCGQLSTVLLAVLSVRKIYDCFEGHNARIISLGVIFAWMLPQCIYLFTNEALIGDRLPVEQHVDRLVLTLPPILTDSLSDRGSVNTSDSAHRIGFVFCSHKLIPSVVSHLSWHYVVLVIPLSALVFLCFVGQALNKQITRIGTHKHNRTATSNCDCCDDLLISTSLYFNLMWLLLLRPLIVLQTILLRPTSASSPASYVDFGTHFVLVFAALFVPFSSTGGFRSAHRSRSIDSIDSGRTCSYFESEEPACPTRYRNLPPSIGSRCELYRY